MEKIIENVPVEKFIANDGSKHDTEAECLAHEDRVAQEAAEQKLVNVPCVDVNSLMDALFDHNALSDLAVYYIQTEEEYEALLTAKFNKDTADMVREETLNLPCWYVVETYTDDGYGSLMKWDDFQAAVLEHVAIIKNDMAKAMEGGEHDAQ